MLKSPRDFFYIQGIFTPDLKSTNFYAIFLK